VHPVVAAVSAWSSWLRAPGPPVVVAGDLDIGAGWDEPTPTSEHRAVVDALASLGLVSALHHLRDDQGASTTRPTVRLHGHQRTPHHVDHVFAPASAMRSVLFEPWGNSYQVEDLSDLGPLVVDLDWTVSLIRDAH